jgi:hypothetical protein
VRKRREHLADGYGRINRTVMNVIRLQARGMEKKEERKKKEKEKGKEKREKRKKKKEKRKKEKTKQEGAKTLVAWRSVTFQLPVHIVLGARASE